MKPELLSPAGGYEALLAAARNGADAVYLGTKALNARAGAGNFDRDELIRAGDYLHERGKKLYVTVNTVVKQSELGILEDVAQQLYACRADAAIVQDMGVCAVLRQMLPALRLHASTQMAISNVQGAKYLKQRGFERVVLAREMDLEEIRACSQTGIQTEVFCHGALCVSCSGQCLFSSLVGGRSGNRGQCAQPCRLEYEMSGAARAGGYLLSPKDLCTAQILGEFERAGVTSLKIEGRLKRPEYVAVVTSVYRRVLDGEALTQEHMEALRQIFNRGGFTRGYAQGIRDGEFLSVKRPSHWGVKVAAAVGPRKIIAEKTLTAGDALVLRSEDGGELPIKLKAEAGQDLPNPAGKAGTVYRLVSEAQMSAARRSYEKEEALIPLNAILSLCPGSPVKLALNDGAREVCMTGETVQKAVNSPLDKERIAAQLRKTGGTAYRIADVKIDAAADAYLPICALNALRREGIAQLAQKRIQALSPQYQMLQKAVYPQPEVPGERSVRIVVQSGDLLLLRELLSLGADEAVYEPDDLRPNTLSSLKLDGMFLYLPPVLHTESLRKLNEFAQTCPLKGVYLSNPGQFALHWPGERRYDFALNIANTPAIDFLGIRGQTYTPSAELTAGEMHDLGGAQELIVYGRMPLMRLRHCPLNAARGGGVHTLCRACDTAKDGKRLEDAVLTDRMHAEFPLRRLASDEGCVVDLLNSVPLNMSGKMSALKGYSGMRLLFTDEPVSRAKEVLADFLRIREGESDILPQGRFTTGHYFKKT